MNDPPTALVGFGTGRARVVLRAEYEQSTTALVESDECNLQTKVCATFEAILALR